MRSVLRVLLFLALFIPACGLVHTGLGFLLFVIVMGVWWEISGFIVHKQERYVVVEEPTKNEDEQYSRDFFYTS